MEPLELFEQTSKLASYVSDGLDFYHKLFPAPDKEDSIITSLNDIKKDIQQLHNQLEALGAKIDMQAIYAATHQADSTINDWFGLVCEQLKTGALLSADAGTGADIYTHCLTHLEAIHNAVTGVENDHNQSWLDAYISQLMTRQAALSQGLPTSVCELAYREIRYLYAVQLRGIICYAAVAPPRDTHQITAQQHLTQMVETQFPAQAEVYQKIVEKWHAQEDFTWFYDKDARSSNEFADGRKDDLRNICMDNKGAPWGHVLTGAWFGIALWQGGMGISSGVPGTQENPTDIHIDGPPFNEHNNVDILTSGTGGSFYDPEIYFDTSKVEAIGHAAFTGLQFRLRGVDNYEPQWGAHAGMRTTWFDLLATTALMSPGGLLPGPDAQNQTKVEEYSDQYVQVQRIMHNLAGGITYDKNGSLIPRQPAAPINGISFVPGPVPGMEEYVVKQVRIRLKNSLKLPFFGDGRLITIGTEYALYHMDTCYYIWCLDQDRALGQTLTPNPVKPLKAYASLHYDKYREEGYKDDYADGTHLPFQDLIKLKFPGHNNSVGDPLFMAPENGKTTGTVVAGGFWDYIIYDPHAYGSKSNLKVGQPFFLVALTYGADHKVIGYPVCIDGGVEIDDSISIKQEAPEDGLKTLMSKHYAKYLWQFRPTTLMT
ncbi:MAG: hypothetical protein SF053_20170 [Bacteroidia bacterium]|nr:hypothetical protein [Bacteroidia bacterium]